MLPHKLEHRYITMEKIIYLHNIIKNILMVKKECYQTVLNHESKIKYLFREQSV